MARSTERKLDAYTLHLSSFSYICTTLLGKQLLTLQSTLILFGLVSFLHHQFLIFVILSENKELNTKTLISCSPKIDQEAKIYRLHCIFLIEILKEDISSYFTLPGFYSSH